MKLIVTWPVPDRAIKGISQKKIERSGLLWKAHFFNPTLLFFQNLFLLFIFLRNRFVLKKTTQKHHSELFLLHHALSRFAESHNLLQLLCPSNLTVTNVPHLCFLKVLLVNSLQSGKAWQECAQQTEKSYSHTNCAVQRQVYVHVLLVQHLYSVIFQYMVWYGPTLKTAWMQRRKEDWLKYTNFTELNITSRICSNCSNLSSLFFKSSNLVTVHFISLKNNCFNCTTVLVIFLFAS